MSMNNSLKSRGEGHGESMYTTRNKFITAQTLLAKWYQHSINYDYTSPRYDRKAAHFTQMIWKNTTQVGVGVFVK